MRVRDADHRRPVGRHLEQRRHRLEQTVLTGRPIVLRSLLAEAVGASFNAISVASDQSTSDTVAMLSSGRVPFGDAQGKPIPVSRHDLG